MSPEQPELPREEWRAFFDRLSQNHQGHEVTIEILDRSFGDQLEAERLPLASITYDNKDDVLVIAVGGRDGRYPVVLRHMIEHPKRILVDQVSEEIPWAIDVLAGDDSRTIASLYRPAEAAPD